MGYICDLFLNIIELDYRLSSPLLSLYQFAYFLGLSLKLISASSNLTYIKLKNSFRVRIKIIRKITHFKKSSIDLNLTGQY